MNDVFEASDATAEPPYFDRCMQRVVHEFCFHRSPEVVERMRGTIECFASRYRGVMPLDPCMSACDYDSIANRPLSNAQIAMLLAEATPRAMELVVRNDELALFFDAGLPPSGSGLPENREASNEDVIRSFIRECRRPGLEISTLHHLVAIGFAIRTKIKGLKDIILPPTPFPKFVDFSLACDMLQPPLLQHRQEAILIGLGLVLPPPVVMK